MAKKKLYPISKASKRPGPNKERGEATLSVVIHQHDLSNKALQELQGFLSLAVDFETGCIVPEHKNNPDKYCKEKCALDPLRGALQQVQVCGPDKKVHIVRLKRPYEKWPVNLTNLLATVPVKLVQYTQFEISWALQQLGISPSGLWICTKIGAQMLDPESKEKHSLPDIAKKYLGIEILKDDELWKWGWDQKKLSPRQIEYSAHDVIHLHDIYRELVKKLQKTNSVTSWYRFCRIQEDLVKLEVESRTDRRVLGR